MVTRWCWRRGGRFWRRHHHFESVEAAVKDGVDIIPTVELIRESDPVRRIGDTERGDEIRARIGQLEELIRAYGRNLLLQRPSPAPQL